MNNLKTSLPTLLICLICSKASVYAQDKKEKSTDTEFGIIAFDYGSITVPSEIDNKDNNYGVANGLFIKKHMANKSYRVALSYRTASISDVARDNNRGVNDSLNRTGDYSRAVVSIGGEKIFFKRKMFQSYWGIDLSLLIGKYRGTSETRTLSYGYNTITTESGAGLGSFAGARITFLDRFRFSVEPRITSFLSRAQKVKRDLSSSQQIDHTQIFSFDSNLQVYAMISYLF